MLKNPRAKTQIVHLAQQVYPENIASFHKTCLEVSKEPHTYLFLDLTQSINDLLRFRTKLFPGEITYVFAAVQADDSIEVAAHILHVLRDAKPQVRRALPASSKDDLIKAIVE